MTSEKEKGLGEAVLAFFGRRTLSVLFMCLMLGIALVVSGSLYYFIGVPSKMPEVLLSVAEVPSDFSECAYYAEITLDSRVIFTSTDCKGGIVQLETVFVHQFEKPWQNLFFMSYELESELRLPTSVVRTYRWSSATHVVLGMLFVLTSCFALLAVCTSVLLVGAVSTHLFADVEFVSD